MCGIAGAWSISNPLRGLGEARVAAMVSAMKHRGPDDARVVPVVAGTMGMCRLAIIDTLGGKQPIANENGFVQTVLNGEIYNYRELTALLRENGHTFATASDAEVLVHLYEESPSAMPSRLNGMFAYAISDSARVRLSIARDRFGQKPLFYCIAEGALWFASELGPLVQNAPVSRRASLPGLRHYLRTGFVPSPMTAFEDVLELPPGWQLIVDASGVTLEPWRSGVSPSKPIEFDARDPVSQLRELLVQAVRRHMVADVPVGAFLSGGIDSSSIVAAMRQTHSGRIRTFTAKFDQPRYDESKVARGVARHLGTDHSEIEIPSRAFEEDDVMRVVRHMGQPFSDSSAIPTFLVSSEVARHVKVCLSGDGGDEVFGGYPIFQWIAQIDRLATVIPGPVRRKSLSAVNALQRIWPDAPTVLRRVRRVLEVSLVPEHERLRATADLMSEPEVARLSPLLAGLEPLPFRGLAGHGRTRLRRLMDERVAESLNSDMLVKVDRMSMAASLEVRAPMLDEELVDWSLQLPDDRLVSKGVGKRILRDAVSPWLPPEVFRHPKMGFSIPLHAYGGDKYKSMCHRLLAESPFAKALFNADSLSILVQRGLSRHVDRSDYSVYRATHQLWAVVTLAAWADYYEVTI